jgi:hypothetical protein
MLSKKSKNEFLSLLTAQSDFDRPRGFFCLKSRLLGGSTPQTPRWGRKRRPQTPRA